jgi:hypothetical protein
MRKRSMSLVLGVIVVAVAAVVVVTVPKALRLYSNYQAQESERETKVQMELESEFRCISPPDRAAEIRHGTVPGLASGYYKTDMSYAEIKDSYDRTLRECQWKFFREQPIIYDGHDYGGKEFVYCKGSYAAEVQYAGGQESQFGWTFAFNISTGLEDCK